MDIRSRLSRIRGLGPAAGIRGPGEALPPGKPVSPKPKPKPVRPEGILALKERGWVPVAGALTLRRAQVFRLPIPLPEILPSSLDVLAPGGGGRPPESLRFFDLETTGLSVGAGTIAFLAALGFPERGEGRGRRGACTRLRIVQYLLLDYPGEGEFLEALVRELGPPSPPAVVSYNGKTFDVQILRNRCLVQGIVPPVFEHLDLLHSARRLWRGVLPSCSQAVVETEILSLSREGDLPGAFAPDSWFEFLKNGNPGMLLRICDHNSRDILGLASLLGCLCRIALDPLEEGRRYSADPEQLALSWQRALDRGCGGAGLPMARALLERAAALGRPRCCRRLAVEAEWRRGDIRGALDLVERALAPPGGGAREMPAWLRNDLEGRRERLLRKAPAGRGEG
jgi:uncharacterized protein YprB with RNaseH-like and TPR domain